MEEAEKIGARHTAYIGQQQFLLNTERELSVSEAELYFKTEKTDQIQPLQQVISQWIGRHYPMAVVSFAPPETVFEKLFDTGEADIVAELYSRNKEVTPEGYVEGPFMFKKNGKYYFMWSEGGWTGPDYSVAYAIADSPFGPFERLGKILQQDPEVATGAGHHSVIQVPGTEEYYIVYHRRPLGDKEGNHRVTCIDRMTFDEQGHINPVKITFEGVEARPIR